MNTKVIRSLLINDTRLIARDPMLLIMGLMILVMGGLLRFGLPALDANLAASGVMPSESGGMRFSETYPVFVVFIGLWQGANIPGIIFGFLLLDEKDDNTLQAMRVSPLPFAGYAAYRVALSSLLAFSSALYMTSVAGICSVPLLPRIAIAVGAALTAPPIALFLVIFANNKVQGLALTKFLGVSGLIVLLGFFAPMPWQWGLSVFPPFLIAKSYWMLLDSDSLFWLPLLLGIFLQLALLRVMLKQFSKLGA